MFFGRFAFLNAMDILDSTFNDKIQEKEYKNKVKPTLVNTPQLLQSELKDLHPEVLKNITENLKSSNVDRNKYRDLFLIKKRIINDNGVKITEFDITERIIPKTPTLASIFTNNPYMKMMFFLAAFCLSALVVTTTIKMYQSIIKLAYIKHITKSGTPQQIVV